MFKGKKVIVSGERDDVPGSILRTLVEAAGGEVIFELTQCAVWTESQAASYAEQAQVKDLADKYGAENIIIIFGFNIPMRLNVEGTTYKSGDPGLSGPLGNIALDIDSYHVLEIKEYVPEDVWEEEMDMKELELEDAQIESIIAVMKEVRGE